MYRKQAFFSERSATFLYKLEKQTIEIVTIFKKVIEIIEEFEAACLKKE